MSSALRTAGWGTLGFALAFFLTFAINTVVNIAFTRPYYGLAADMAADFWGGVVYLATWSSAGVALGVAAIALPALAWPEGGTASLTCFSSNVAFSVFDQSTPCGFGRWL